jgi:hypothetical protein
MCEQSGVGYRRLSDECPLVDAATGRVVSPSADRVVDEHFNCVLDAIGEWRRVTRTSDTSLLGKPHLSIHSIKHRFRKDHRLPQAIHGGN